MTQFPRTKIERNGVQGRQGRQIPTKKNNFFENSFYILTAASDTDEKIIVQEISYFSFSFARPSSDLEVYLLKFENLLPKSAYPAYPVLLFGLLLPICSLILAF